MRRDVRKTGKRNLKKYATLYNVTTAAVSLALNGRTFKSVDSIEAPIVGFLPPAVKPAKIRERGLSVAQKQELANLRREDPLRWTYTALASKLREDTGLWYKPGNVAFILRKFDPSIAELEKIKPASLPESRKKAAALHHLVCVICEETFLTKHPTREVCSSPACRKVVKSAQAYDLRHSAAS